MLYNVQYAYLSLSYLFVETAIILAIGCSLYKIQQSLSIKSQVQFTIIYVSQKRPENNFLPR